MNITSAELVNIQAVSPLLTSPVSTLDGSVAVLLPAAAGSVSAANAMPAMPRIIATAITTGIHKRQVLDGNKLFMVHFLSEMPRPDGILRRSTNPRESFDKAHAKNPKQTNIL